MENEIINNEELLGPRKVDLTYVGLIAIGSAVAGFLGGVVTLLFVYLFGSKVGNAEGVYVYLFAIGGFFTSSICVFMTLWMNKLIAPDKYRYGSITFVQLAVFSVLLFIFTLPLYIYIGSVAQNIIYVFVAHILLSILGSGIITETLSNYRYVLLGIYGSLAGFLLTTLLVVLFFMNIKSTNAALFGLIGVVIIGNILTNLLRSLTEFLYYKAYQATGTDMLGDIYYQIESEEREIIEKAKKQLEKF